MYRIGLFSQMTHITVKALRYYDEEGLFKPAHVDPFTGYRYYRSEQLADIHRIIELRQIGFSIEEIVALLRDRNTQSILEKKRKELAYLRRETSQRIKRLDYFIKSSSFDGERSQKMQYNAVIKKIPECIVYAKRFIAPDYNSYMTLIPAIGKEIAAANPTLKCAQPPYCFIHYFDGEYREQDIDIEYCEAVEYFGKATGDITFKKMPPVTVISVMHKGTYHNLPHAYQFVLSWIEDNGYQATGNPRESYIDGIWNTENEADWLTELQFPVVPANTVIDKKR